ncbi:hypothetical protein [Pelagibacterium sp.]|uniref:hypothetical protein n=1 Tax=Pelagibacterium sp. TaxID=1967288 RepID=UPI003A956B5C
MGDRYAVVSHGVVINLVIGEKPSGYADENHAWVECTGANAAVEIGWRLQGDGSYAPPAISPPPEPEEPAA